MECFLSPRRTRTVFQCVSFGAILAWILLGSYMRPEEKAETATLGVGEDRGWSTRHLLSTSMSELGGRSQKMCEALDMFYGRSGVMVSLEDDQVSQCTISLAILFSLV